MKNQKIQQLKKLSTLLDSKFEGPLGIKFGLDALIGLIPLVGDWFGVISSIYIISEASRLGVSNATLVRMAINVAVENIIDMIPFLGNIFDFYWKANNRNMELLERHLLNPPRETIKSRTIVAIICMALLLLLVATGYITFIILEALVSWILALPALQ